MNSLNNNAMNAMSASSSLLVILDQFVNSSNVKSVLLLHEKLNQCLNIINSTNERVFGFQYFQLLRKAILARNQSQKWVRISAIISKLDKRSRERIYGGNVLLRERQVLVIGGGISGLRVSIELLLLGAKVTCVEKRDKFSRNNVIHLWPNVISDLKGLGAKRFYGQFCVGAIDHISIRCIQLIELKIALILGLNFVPNVTFDKICPKLIAPQLTCDTQRRRVREEHVEEDGEEHADCQCCCHAHGFGGGARAHFYSTISGDSVTELESQSFDIIVGSDGRRNTLSMDFPRKEFRGKLAIAITANFVNNRTEAEVRVPEISGVSYIYNQKWFKDLLNETGIQLENICYYRDETHYFVMTATKQSLLARRVLREDKNETHLLLHDNNINREELLSYARSAAEWTSGLKGLSFAVNAQRSADVALFDFTSVYAAKNASRAKRVHTRCCAAEGEERPKHVLMMLCGDSLLEPFWPTGSGAGRGFLSALDAAWAALQWTMKVRDNNDDETNYEAMLDVIAERESIYRLLAQTTPENINSKDFSLMPSMRYTNWRQNSKFEIRNQIKYLIGFDSNKTSNIDQSINKSNELHAKRARRATVAVTSHDFKENNIHDDLHDQLEVKHSNVELMNARDNNNSSGHSLEITFREPLNSAKIAQKADWLLGSLGALPNTSHAPNVPHERASHKKSSDIVERAHSLQKVLNETFSESNCPKVLSKVGKIEENDWNFRVWNNSSIFVPKTDSKPKPLLENSREILKSRVNQLETKMAPKLRENNETKTNISQEWIQRLSQELNQRMKKANENNEEKERAESSFTSASSSARKQCVRCLTDVNAMERISVSGEVLHRSCLCCSKCGISLRLNEFRNELKFLCIFCLKSNEKEKQFLDKNEISFQLKKNDSKLFKAKELFLEKVEKIDFRERIEFENKEIENNETEIELIENNESGSDLNDLSRSSANSEEFSDSNESEDNNSSNWETEEEQTESHNESDESESEAETDSPEDISDTKDSSFLDKSKKPLIPSISICDYFPPINPIITNNNNNNNSTSISHAPPPLRYNGCFTEKLFRSRSQPLLFNLKLFQNAKQINETMRDNHIKDANAVVDSHSVPYFDDNEDIENDCDVYYSGRRKSSKAPIIEMEDI